MLFDCLPTLNTELICRAVSGSICGSSKSTAILLRVIKFSYFQDTKVGYMLGSPLKGLRHRYHWLSVIPVSGQFLLSAPGLERNAGGIHAPIAIY